MPDGAESLTEVASQRAHVHALAGPNFEDGAIEVRAVDAAQFDRRRTCLADSSTGASALASA